MACTYQCLQYYLCCKVALSVCINTSFSTILKLTTATTWNFNTTFDERMEIYSNLTTNMNIVRNITSGSGAYLVRLFFLFKFIAGDYNIFYYLE